MAFEHKSVLLYETVDSLNIRPDGIYVDGTLGGGGHAYEVCRRLGEHGRLIGIDQDADAIAAATKRLEPFADKVTVVRSMSLVLRRWTAFIWIWEFPPISWILLPGGLPTGRMRRWICVWTSGIPRRQLIL